MDSACPIRLTASIEFAIRPQPQRLYCAGCDCICQQSIRTHQYLAHSCSRLLASRLFCDHCCCRHQSQHRQANVVAWPPVQSIVRPTVGSSVCSTNRQHHCRNQIWTHCKLRWFWISASSWCYRCRRHKQHPWRGPNRMHHCNRVGTDCHCHICRSDKSVGLEFQK